MGIFYMPTRSVRHSLTTPAFEWSVGLSSGLHTHCPSHPEAQSVPAVYQGTVQQYGGVDILAFTGDGKATLNFNGDQRVKLIPAEAHSGERFWWSNRNDSTFATSRAK